MLSGREGVGGRVYALCAQRLALFAWLLALSPQRLALSALRYALNGLLSVVSCLWFRVYTAPPFRVLTLFFIKGLADRFSLDLSRSEIRTYGLRYRPWWVGYPTALNIACRHLYLDLTL